MNLTAAAAMVSLFGSTSEVCDLVKNFDFNKIDVKDISRQGYLTAILAPSYGKLTRESIKLMDDNLKVMIAGTVKTLAEILPENRSWDAIMSAMLQCPFIEPSEDAVARADELIKSATNVFKFDAGPHASIVEEVQSWFLNLIQDQEVLNSTQIDINVLANVVARTGATIDNFETFFFKNEGHEKTLVDIGVLRFPDAEKPHFQIYRIKLTAWSQSYRVIMVQDDNNGITGDYISRKFKARESIMNKMTKASRDAAVKDADGLFRTE